VREDEAKRQWLPFDHLIDDAPLAELISRAEAVIEGNANISPAVAYLNLLAGQLDQEHWGSGTVLVKVSGIQVTSVRKLCQHAEIHHIRFP
jgi:hypothetical protein